MIHRTAIIDPSARIASDVRVGPYSLIAPGCDIGEGTIVRSHVVIGRNSKIGKGNRIYSHAVIGEDPQDLKYSGEETCLEMGDSNIIREFVTISRGTEEGGGKTIIGNGNLAMAYVHVAHDCKVGNEVIMANAVTLGGHVEVHDHAVIGGLTGVHQFVRIGAHSIIGAISGVGKDIPPYVTAVPSREGKKVIFGLNIVGLKRRGFDKATIEKLKGAVKLMGQTEITVAELIQKWENEFGDSLEVRNMIEFFKNSKRGVERV
jgi:UDP-N-acetylglucosamine acyltransferase